MDKIVNFYVDKFKKQHSKRRLAVILLTPPALILAIFVCWQLHLTGTALSGGAEGESTETAAAMYENEENVATAGDANGLMLTATAGDSVAIGENTYTTSAVDTFYLWIWTYENSTYTKAGGYSEWDSNAGISDALKYTDSEDTTYYLVPVEYFEDALGTDYDYVFDSTSTLTCPFIYAPDANATLADKTDNISSCLFAYYVQVGSDWYVQLTDTTSGYSIPRCNVYYNPEYYYELYFDVYETLVQSEYITDFIGVDYRQILIPISHFSVCFSEETLDTALSSGYLDTTGTITINGVEYTTYSSRSNSSSNTTKYCFRYRPYFARTDANDGYYVKIDDTWYLLIQDKGTGYTIPVKNKIRYIGTVESGVVFSLDNSNGSSTSKDYSNSALRYTAAVGGSGDEDGNVTINLPSDSDLGTKFTVFDETEDKNAVTVTFGREAESSKYNYKLVGWINIATGEYYNVEDGPATATVNLNNDNVFYADWIADSYDCKGNDGTVIETEDTSSFVKIRVFDFSELFNLYSASVVQDGLSSETWSDSGSFYNLPLLANDSLSSIGNSFVFFNTYAYGTVGSIGQVSGRSSWNYFTGNSIFSGRDFYNGAYQDLYDEDIISKLFRTTTRNSVYNLGTYYVGEANYLFSYDSTVGSSTYGYYSYDSSTNAAVYQQSDSRFYVYNSPQTYGGSASSSIFLPFNSYSSSSTTYTTSNGKVNFWFGLSIELSFYLPNDTATVLDAAEGSYGNQVNETDMIFEFSGDDDIWILIDGEMVLDMGGVHNALNGTINFSTGEVTIKKNDGTTWQSTTIKKLLGEDLSAGTHTLTIYYMERGASSSNLAVSFNVVPEWLYESAKADTMKVTKIWEDEDEDPSCPETVTVGLFQKTVDVDSDDENLEIEDLGDGTYKYIYIRDGTTYEITDGYSYDTSTGYVNAYYNEENGYIYVLVDTETLTGDDWTYTWELLSSTESEDDYEILELGDWSAYTVTYEYDDITENENYWSIVGSDELNGTVTVEDNKLKSYTGILYDGLEILLTDGAQDQSNTIGTYTGYAIQNYSDDVTTDTIDFSQQATLDSTTGIYTYGVASGIDDSDIWIVQMTGDYDSFEIEGITVYTPTFYLKSKTNGYYLGIYDRGNTYTTLSERYSLQLVEDQTDAVAFSYNALGELNTPSSPGLKIVISNGEYTLVSGRESSTSSSNVKIYIQNSATYGRAYTITNKFNTYVLPVTGGSGRGLFILFGLIFISSATFSLLRLRRTHK